MNYLLFFLLIQMSRSNLISNSSDTRNLLPSFDFTTVNIVFVYGPTRNDYDSYLLEQSTQIIQNSHFERSRPTVLYFHGYTENLQSESVRVITDAYLQRNDHNILILDWSKIADGNYIFETIPGMFALSSVLANAVIRMFQNGLTTSNLHLVGHSLGAQFAGLLASNIYTTSKYYYKVKRVTGLDPAFPLFILPNIFPINRFEADLVDIIHTDAGIFGGPVMTGSVDFWPNGGRAFQPGCSVATYQYVTSDDVEFCSHQRSWRYWAESVATTNRSFHAVKSGSFLQFRFGNIEASPTQAYMGIDASPILTGNYYLQTSSVFPFSRGEYGMKYRNY